MPYRNCENCDKRFYTCPSAIKQGFGRYCSIHCSNIGSNPALSRRISPEIEEKIINAYLSGQSKTQAGLPYGYGRGGVDKVLRRRGIAARTPSQALKGRIFTAEHREQIARNHHDVAGKNNPMYGKPPGHGKRIFVTHLNQWVRSTWEATIAQVLHDLSIPHEYESIRIQLNDATYLPDFYLPTHDLYIEVKGWMGFRSAKVLDQVHEQYPYLRLIVIGPNEYEMIKQSPGALLSLIS